jgi:hypothetical protein
MHPTPLIEPDRFFAGPRDQRRLDEDAQTNAVERMVMRCERLRPHLRTVEALQAFIDRQPEPGHIRRRIALSLALQEQERGIPGPHHKGAHTARSELEAFRRLALSRPAAVVWVFG